MNVNIANIEKELDELHANSTVNSYIQTVTQLFLQSCNQPALFAFTNRLLKLTFKFLIYNT